jgi:hypothetical protein
MVGSQQVSTMSAGKLPGDGQSQARAAVFTAAGAVGAVESLENMRQILRGDAWAAVLYSQLG